MCHCVRNVRRAACHGTDTVRRPACHGTGSVRRAACHGTGTVRPDSDGSIAASPNRPSIDASYPGREDFKDRSAALRRPDTLRIRQSRPPLLRPISDVSLSSPASRAVRMCRLYPALRHAVCSVTDPSPFLHMVLRQLVTPVWTKMHT